MQCRNPSCKVGEIVQGQYGAEGDAPFAARLASGFCSKRCKRLVGPLPKDRPFPPLSPVSWHTERTEGVAVEKQRTARDKSFLKWLLPRSCELAIKGGFGPCMGDHIYHHSSSGGISQKGSDLEAITVCFGHHELFDNASKKGIGIFTEQELKRVIARNQMEYVAEGHKIKHN